MSKRTYLVDTFSSLKSFTYITKKDEIRRKGDLPSRIDLWHTQFFVWQQNVVKKNKSIAQHRFILSNNSMCFKEGRDTLEIRETGKMFVIK